MSEHLEITAFRQNQNSKAYPLRVGRALKRDSGTITPWLDERGLVSEESNRWQYRFLDIVDPGTGEPMFRIEHEVRSMTHPIYGRQLVNRNPAVTNNDFVPGHEAAAWMAPPA